MTYKQLAPLYISIFALFLGVSFALEVDQTQNLQSSVVYSFDYQLKDPAETLEFSVSIAGIQSDSTRPALGPVANVPAEYVVSMKNTSNSPLRVFGTELQLAYSESLNVQTTTPLHLYDAFTQELSESTPTSSIYTARTQGGVNLLAGQTLRLFSFTSLPSSPGLQNFTLTVGDISNRERPEITSIPPSVTGTNVNFAVRIRGTETDLTGDGKVNAEDIKHVLANWQEAEVKFPVIMGFSSPADVTNPSTTVEQAITSMITNGIYEIPVYPGGMLTPDGTNLLLPGETNPPNLTNFYQIITRLESASSLPVNTIKTSIYIRASVTQADADLSTSLGLTDITSTPVYTAIHNMIHEIAAGDAQGNPRFGIDPARISRIIIDFEEILASNYDSTDMSATDKVTVTELINFAQGLKTTYPQDEYALDIFIGHGLHPSSEFPGVTSSWTESPRNFISAQDLIRLLTVYSRIEIGAYNVNPGPVNYPSYRDYFKAQYQEVITLTSDATKIRMVIPAFEGQLGNASSATLAESMRVARSIIKQYNSAGVHEVSVFDYGSLDHTEKSLLWD